MKTNQKFIALFLLLLAFSASSFSQNKESAKTTPPSDAPSGFTFDYQKTIEIIIERQVSPSKSNQDVQIILDQKDFPSLKTGEVADSKYKEILGAWIIANQSIIINTLKNRKNIVTQY